MGQQLTGPIKDTTVFDLRLARRGQRLNRMCAALCSPQGRDAFKRDEEAFMSRYGLTDAERELVRRRDFQGLIEAGTNYFLLKIGSARATTSSWAPRFRGRDDR